MLEYLPPRLSIRKLQESQIYRLSTEDPSGGADARAHGTNVERGFEHGTKSPSFNLISCCSLCAGAASDVGREAEGYQDYQYNPGLRV